MTKNAPMDDVMPVGLSFAVLLSVKMMLKTKNRIFLPVVIPALAGFCLCLFALPSLGRAAGPAVASVVQASTAAQSNIGLSGAAAALAVQAQSTDTVKRALAASGIAALKTGEKREMLRRMLNDKDARVKAIAAKGLAKDGDASAYPALAEALAGPDNAARLHAVEGMAYLKDPRAVSPLIALLKHKDLNTRWKTAETLGNFSGRNVVDSLLSTAADETEDVFVRRSAIDSLVNIGEKRALPGLKAIKSPLEITGMAQRAASILEVKK
ncbi:MAG: HEAT repeat domain-containing protein [Elusimicrobia bacterium]|nr:HEAT repeat domain-containing protein [Elusimicrobiota bacterium]